VHPQLFLGLEDKALIFLKTLVAFDARTNNGIISIESSGFLSLAHFFLMF